MDQAAVLRRLETLNNGRDDSMVSSDVKGCEILLVTSGKGGVGKSILTANIAMAAGKRDAPVLVIDADLKGSHQGMLLGITPRFNMIDVVNGNVSLYEAIDGSSGTVHLLSGADELVDDGNFRYGLQRIISDNLFRLSHDYKLILIDSGSYLLENIVTFSRRASSTLLVTTTDVTSITDTYALIKYLSGKVEELRIQLLVNLAQSEEQAEEIYKRLELMTSHFLGLAFPYAGYIATEDSLRNSVDSLSPLIERGMDERISDRFSEIVDRVNHGGNGMAGMRSEVQVVAPLSK